VRDEGQLAFIVSHRRWRRRAPGWATRGSTRVGQVVALTPALGLRLDEALVLQELEGRVDRAGARAPDAVGAGVELLDDLVAVHGPLEQQREDRGTDVEAGAAAAAALASEAGAAWAERAAGTAGAELGAAEREPEAEPATHAPAVMTFSVVPHDYLRSVVDS